MWKSGQSADRSSDFLMEARNLHFCVKCPDFPMLAPLSVFSVLQTKRNASWRPARTLCVASEVTAAPLGGSRRSPQWRAKLGGGAGTWADRRRPSKRQPVSPAQPGPRLPPQALLRHFRLFLPSPVRLLPSLAGVSQILSANFA